MRSLINPDKKKCKKCGACSEVCPMRIIEISKDQFPEAKDGAYKLCINCGYCADVCAHDALNHVVRKTSGNSDAARRRYKVLLDIKK